MIECLQEIELEGADVSQPEEPAAERGSRHGGGQPPKAASRRKNRPQRSPKRPRLKSKDENRRAKKPEKPAGNFGVKDNENPFGN